MRNGLSSSLTLASLVSGLGLVACSAQQQAATPPQASAAQAPVTQETSLTPAEASALNASRSATDLTTDDVALVFDPLYFAFNSEELAQEARSTLEELANYLSKHPSASVTVSGHCDERGTAEYNLALGERRANAVKDYLTSLGVAGNRLRTLSYGEERQVCDTDEESCWSQNRRAHMLITGRS
ncbi:MAG TPA: peptidoglycan-associated lipoprotein Pal, partial [Myxococcota bacterium]|nr:peptidoglycan-associated lipoprotein Pal [Myxococcota bacterium]